MKKRILVVEDECLIRLWLGECLLDDGFEVVEAENGDQALGLIGQSEAFDLLITDIGMPGLADGNVVATAAKRCYPSLPVIYVSGRPDSVKNALGWRDRFIAKPYSGDEMSAMARRLLDADGDQATMLSPGVVSAA